MKHGNRFFVWVSFILLFVFLSIPKNTLSGGGGGGGGGKGENKNPTPSCPTIVNKTITLNLSFMPPTYQQSPCAAPEPLSNPYYFAGTNNMSNACCYYCKVTVVPNIPSNCTYNVILRASTFKSNSNWI